MSGPDAGADDTLPVEPTPTSAETDLEQTLLVGSGDGAVADPEARIAHYRVLRELGRGGQGAVYLAEDVELGRPVALKLLSGAMSLSSEARLRFRREAETASKLDHPGICTVYGFGEHEGTPYIAMRYVEGRSLDRVVRDARQHREESATSSGIALDAVTSSGDSHVGDEVESSGTTLREVVAFVESAARAVHAAHEAGLIHRDIKPGNIMVAANGGPVILDFGLARDDSSEGPALTGSGDVMGTPAYMAPEQISAKGAKLDRRADVYALGVALYECLTLQRPFEGPTREALYRAILTKEAADPRRLNPAISSDLKVVLEVALAKDRNQRYQSAEAFADDLRAVIQSRPIAARPISLAGRLLRWARRQPAAATLAGVLALGIPALVGLGTYIVVRQPLLREADLAAQRRASEALVQQGFLAAEDGDRDEAIAAFERARVDGRIVPEALVGIVLAHFEPRAWKKAVAALDAHPTVTARYAGLRALRTWCEAKRDGASDIDALDATSFEPTEPVDFFLLGSGEIARGESGDTEAWGKALAHLAQAILRSPSPKPSYYFQAVFAAGHAGDDRGVNMLLPPILALWPENPSSYYWCGTACLRYGDPESARTVLERGLKVAPHAPRLHFALGAAHRTLGNFEPARESLREAARLDPTYPDPHVQLGDLSRAAGDPETALTHYEEAIRINPEEDDAFANRAEALIELDRYEEARSSLESAAAIDPYYAPFRIRLADVLTELGDFAALLEQARELVRHTPEHGVAVAEKASASRLVATAATIYHELALQAPQRFTDPEAGLPLRAARAAVRAASGSGKDAAGSSASPAQWRERARGWLEADLQAIQEQVKAGSLTPSAARRRLRRWERDRVLDSVRDADLLDALPPDERAAWQALWDSVERVRDELP